MIADDKPLHERIKTIAERVRDRRITPEIQQMLADDLRSIALDVEEFILRAQDATVQRPVKVPSPSPSPNPEAMILTIIGYVAQGEKVAAELVRGRDRSRAVVMVRHVSMWLSYRLLEIGYSRLGRVYSNRDHSSVMHGVQRIDHLYETDDKARLKLDTYLHALRIELFGPGALSPKQITGMRQRVDILQVELNDIRAELERIALIRSADHFPPGSE